MNPQSEPDIGCFDVNPKSEPHTVSFDGTFCCNGTYKKERSFFQMKHCYLKGRSGEQNKRPHKST